MRLKHEVSLSKLQVSKLTILRPTQGFRLILSEIVSVKYISACQSSILDLAYTESFLIFFLLMVVSYYGKHQVQVEKLN